MGGLISEAGQRVEPAFPVYAGYSRMEVMTVAWSSGRFIVLGRRIGALQPETYSAIMEEVDMRPPILRSMTRTTNGDWQVEVLGETKFSYGFQYSTNLTTWQWSYRRGWLGSTYILPAVQTGSDSKVFYRCFEHRNTCISNLRSIDEAKAQWALDYGKSNNDTPAGTDLFGPGKYLPSTLICPVGTAMYYPPSLINPQHCPNVASFTDHWDQ